MSSPRWVRDRLPHFDSIWPCEGTFGAVKDGLTAAHLIVSTTCEACALATASFGRKQAGRCTGAPSPTAAVRSRDLHLPRCFHREQHAQAARSPVFSTIRPRRTYVSPRALKALGMSCAAPSAAPNYPEPLSYAP
jgi:hypothetical protein